MQKQLRTWQLYFDWNSLHYAKKGLQKTVDLKKKQKDFEHLLFNKTNSEKILRFGEFVGSFTE
ncbi:hypothetical protein DMB45_01215 [Sanguibacteroides justesenii]|nr:hypothetical protein DMB45_01215 [Sanguibacteroides justesenii]